MHLTCLTYVSVSTVYRPFALGSGNVGSDSIQYVSVHNASVQVLFSYQKWKDGYFPKFQVSRAAI